jgi:hypothetical protein
MLRMAPRVMPRKFHVLARGTTTWRQNHILSDPIQVLVGGEIVDVVLKAVFVVGIVVVGALEVVVVV